MHLYSPLRVRHAPFISSCLILSPEQYLAGRRDQEASHYATVSILVSLPLS
jgi:hypothetical protein